MKQTKTTGEFADTLSDLIKTSGKDVRTLAKEIGISTGALSNYQSNKAEAGINAFIKIAKYFRVSYEFLLGESENKEHKNVPIGKEFGLSDKTVENLRYTFQEYNDKDFGFKEGEYRPINILNHILENDEFDLFLFQFCESLNYKMQKSARMYELLEIEKTHQELGDMGVVMMTKRDYAKHYLHEAKQTYENIWSDLLNMIGDENDGTEK